MLGAETNGETVGGLLKGADDGRNVEFGDGGSLGEADGFTEGSTVDGEFVTGDEGDGFGAVVDVG